ncbi:MAG: hypothetical protein NVSMB20_16000 [Bradyrhizobium sp.]
MSKFAYRGFTSFPVPAPVAAAEIQRVSSAAGGEFTPGLLVVASRPARAPLHGVFEWDDARAAEAYRVEQAKALIRNIVVVSEQEEIGTSVRAFVSVVSRSVDHAVYVPVDVAMSEPDYRAQVLANALRDMEAFSAKYRHLCELDEAFSGMAKARRRIKKALQPAE